MLFNITPVTAGFRPYFILSAALCALLLGGCATPNRVPLPPGHKEELAPASGVIGMRQQEIGTSINRSNLTVAAGGGLLFALIDSGINNSRAKKAESAASSIRDALIDYKPAEVLAAALKVNLSPESALPLEDVQIVQIKDTKTIPERISANASKTVVILDTSYQLLPNFDGAKVSIVVSIHPATGKMGKLTTTRSKLPPLCYFNVFSSVHYFPMPGKVQAAEAAKLWSSGEGQRAREILDHAFAETATMLAHDLRVAAPSENALYKTPKSAEVRTVEVPGGPPLMVRGYTEKIVDNRVWVRCPGGELCAVPR